MRLVLRVGMLATIFALVAAAPAAAVAPPGPTPGVLAAPGLVQAKLVATNGAAGDYFGHGVAISGDTAIVGANLVDVAGRDDQGAAYVFVRTGGAWTLQQRLVAADGAAGDGFGWHVALDGDTAVVGAFYDDVGEGIDQGSAYVFTRAGTRWTLQQKLTAADGAGGDQFGGSVALHGDTALVGAAADDIGPEVDQGSAYVFTRTGRAWTKRAKLTAEDGAAYDYFGGVELSGGTALVASYADDVGGVFDQGSAYVFVGSGANWAQQARLTAPDGSASEGFGTGVALDGDTAAVGCVYDTVGTSGAQGSVYVFTRTGQDWGLQQKLTARDGAAEDTFGRPRLDGDVLVATSYFADVGGNADQGAGYVFTRSGGVWTERDKLVAPDGAAGDHLAVADVENGTVLLGAFEDDVDGDQDRGSVGVFLVGAPFTVASVSPAANAAGWHRSPVTVTLAATPVSAAVAATHVRIGDAGAFSVYDPAHTPVIATNGVKRVWFTSTDEAGNVEGARSFVLRIDRTRPAPKALAAASVTRGRVATLRLRVDDAVSPDAKVTVRIYRADRLKKTLNLGLLRTGRTIRHEFRCTLPRGRYQWRVSATDLAGNREARPASRSLTVK